MSKRTGVLLVNLGTPDSPTRKSVYKYLKEFLLDGRVIDIPWIPRNLLVRGIIAPFRSGASAKLYQELWMEEGSPLKVYGEILEKNVQDTLGDEYVVKLAMRYQNPSIASKLEELLQLGVDRLIVFPLFPHYASATTGSVHDEVMRLLRKEQTIIDTRFINSYPTNKGMIDAFIERANQYNLADYDHILFSYHGLPVRHLTKADKSCSHCQKVENCCSIKTDANKFCYSAQCHETTEAIAERLALPKDKYSICFQSRLGRDPWIEPYTSDQLKIQADKGAKKLLVFCPAFVADCLETTIEIGVEYQEEFEEFGGEKVQLVEGLNDNETWKNAVCDMIREA